MTTTKPSSKPAEIFRVRLLTVSAPYDLRLWFLDFRALKKRRVSDMGGKKITTKSIPIVFFEDSALAINTK